MLDFDKVQQAPYMLDIARGIHSFGRPGRGSQDIRPDFAKIFVDAYSEVRPVDAAERRALLAFWGMFETARCLDRRWTLYHVGVLLLLYTDLMILAMAVLLFIYP